MSTVLVERHTLRFPFKNSALALVSRSIPGDPDTGTHISMFSPAPFSNIPTRNAEASAQAVVIPKRRDGLQLMAISIAPDSPIHSADIAIGVQQTEVQRHRISPGNPLIGNFDQWDTISVTLPFGMPYVGGSGFNNFFWDTTPDNVAGGTYWGFPLRLECWYGALPVRMDRRAAYRGFARMTFLSAGNRRFGICVDGRTKIAVEIIAGAGSTCTYTIAQVACDLNTGLTASPDAGISADRVITGPTAAAAGALVRFDVLPNATAFGSPYQFLVVTLTEAVAGDHQLSVAAWDS